MVPAYKHLDVARSPISPKLSQDFHGITQNLPLTHMAVLALSKLYLHPLMSASFVHVCLSHLFGDITCVSEKASYGKKCIETFPALALLRQLVTFF